MYEGKTKLITKHLGFLVSKYKMNYLFQSFPKFLGFYGPSDCYSFYNDNGCFTIHNLAQRGEWGLFIAPKFSYNQDNLLRQEINQRLYFDGNYFTDSSWLNALSNTIIRDIKLNNSLFSIKLN